jgi:MFS transporter, DHA1 family, inner membrane transport protein
MTTETPPQNHTFRMIFIITFARLAPNMGRRVLYPFIPAISRLLGVGINDIQTIIAIQSGTGLFSPLATPLSRRFGRKRVMLGALALFIFGGTLGATIGGFAMVLVAFVLFGIAKWVYDPAFQAYLSDKIPYEKRAQALGITELGWAFALVIGAPLTGILLENAGLSAVFWMMTAFALSAFILVALFLPSDKPDKTDEQAERMHIRELLTHPQAIGVLLFVILFLTANEMFFINYGAWMDANFGLSLGALGIATLVIALAEICGEGIVIFYADKIGKKRMVLIGCGLSIVMHLVLPMLNFDLGVALIGLFFIFFVFEIGIVSFLPIISEVLPSERALMMSASSSASAIGRVAGAWLGGMLYALFGSLQSLSFITAAVGVVAMLILWRMVQEG